MTAAFFALRLEAGGRAKIVTRSTNAHIAGWFECRNLLKAARRDLIMPAPDLKPAIAKGKLLAPSDHSAKANSTIRIVPFPNRQSFPHFERLRCDVILRASVLAGPRDVHDKADRSPFDGRKCGRRAVARHRGEPGPAAWAAHLETRFGVAGRMRSKVDTLSREHRRARTLGLQSGDTRCASTVIHFRTCQHAPETGT
jgi:hypothetical protein